MSHNSVHKFCSQLDASSQPPCTYRSPLRSASGLLPTVRADERPGGPRRGPGGDPLPRVSLSAPSLPLAGRQGAFQEPPPPLENPRAVSGAGGVCRPPGEGFRVPDAVPGQRARRRRDPPGRQPLAARARAASAASPRGAEPRAPRRKVHCLLRSSARWRIKRFKVSFKHMRTSTFMNVAIKGIYCLVVSHIMFKSALFFFSFFSSLFIGPHPRSIFIPGNPY